MSKLISNTIESLLLTCQNTTQKQREVLRPLFHGADISIVLALDGHEAEELGEE